TLRYPLRVLPAAGQPFFSPYRRQCLTGSRPRLISFVYASDDSFPEDTKIIPAVVRCPEAGGRLKPIPTASKHQNTLIYNILPTTAIDPHQRHTKTFFYF